MLAELVTTGGLALEVSTSLHPESFLLLACTGNFAKAVGKELGKEAKVVLYSPEELGLGKSGKAEGFPFR